MRSILKSDKSFDTAFNKSKDHQYQENLAPKKPNSVQSNIKPYQDVIQTLNIYLRSAIDLKNNLSLGKSTVSQQSLLMNKKKIDTNEQLSLILTKVQFFIKSCQNELKKINRTIESSSLSQIESISNTYNKVLSFIKDKYAQLLKQSYRTLNLENIHSDNFFSEEDKQIVKQNRKRKLKQISDLEKEMDHLWQNGKFLNGKGIDDLSKISFTNGFMKNPDETKQKHKKKGQALSTSQQKQQKSFIVTFQDSKFHKKRNLEVLNIDTESTNLRQLAKSQLQKQFLQIRIQAYNMYEKYISHNHQQLNESLKFLKEEQDILECQVEEQTKISQEMRQEYERLVRQLSEVKTINELIRKRYVVRESIRMDSEEGVY